MPLPVEMRLFKFIKRIRFPRSPDGCWEWPGSRTVAGYGKMRDTPEKYFRAVCAHRIAYQVFYGPIPKGKELDHLCGNPGCINPYHLEAVTHAVNNRRGRTVKLTAEQVLQIRKSAESNVAVARRYGISYGHALRIRNKNDRYWKEI